MNTASANLNDRNLRKPLAFILLNLVMCLAAPDASAQGSKQFPAMPSFNGNQTQNAPSGQTQNHERTIHFDGTAKMKHEKMDPDRDKLTTIPHWTGEFSYHGISYPYRMVGTDPSKGSATTVVPTVLIPLRFVFADGSVIDSSTELVDGQTPIQGIINSPIFQPYPFSCGGINVGITQWGDAAQRANFWNYVSTRSRDYHVLLGQPTVLPAQTIIVPSDQGGYFLNTAFGFSAVIPVVEADFLEQQREVIAGRLGLDPRSLPIFVTGSVFNTAGNWHGANRVSSRKDPVAGAQTYIVAGYYSQSIFGEYIGDVSALSHELSEWVSDPFGGNFTPGWNLPFSSSAQCDSSYEADTLEVCDQLDPFIASGGVFRIPSGSFTYHLEDRVFLDFFTRTGRSNAANGLFSFFGLITAPTYNCTGHLDFTPTFVDFPDAPFTVVTGINNRGSATGIYNDPAGAQHGFSFTGSKYTTLDYPRAVATTPFKINDSGAIVGSFIDASGGSHGFSYKSGVWTQIDFPGSSDTEVYGVNSAGKIVGSYNGFQSVAHAFVLENRQYQRIDTPFGAQAEALAINDQGSITGIGYTDPFTGQFTLTLLEQMQYLFMFDTEQFFTGPFTPFIRSRNSFSPFQFPGSLVTQIFSINNSNDLAGFFFQPDGATEVGMVTVYGYPYSINGIVFGNDDRNHICGVAYDYNTGQVRGFIGTLPLMQNAH